MNRASRQNLRFLPSHGSTAQQPSSSSQLASVTSDYPASAQQRAELWLCVYLFRLPLDVLIADAGQSAVVTEEKSGRSMVGTVSSLALESGIRIGMTLATALSLNQTLNVCSRDLSAEQRGLESLAARLMAISSRVALYSDASIAIEIQGSLRFFGGMDGLLRRLKRELDEMGYAYTLSLAPTVRAAFWLSQSSGEHKIYRMDALVSALGALSVQLVAQNSKQLSRMQRSGIRCLADLMRLPREGMARRFGTATLKVLDQALGRVPELVNPYHPPEVFSQQREFYLPTHDLNLIRPAAEELLKSFQNYLTQRRSATQRFQCKLIHLNESATVIEVGCSHYASRADHMLMLLEEHLQRLELKADATSVIIESKHIEGFIPGQLDLLDPATTHSQSWCQLIEQFEARLGSECLKRLTACLDHRPEYAFSIFNRSVGIVTTGLPMRPFWLLETPQVLSVVQGLPQWYGSLRLMHPFERIEQGWWDQQDICRDYCVAHNSAGSKLWLYRDRRGRGWFLHGVFA